MLKMYVPYKWNRTVLLSSNFIWVMLLMSRTHVPLDILQLMTTVMKIHGEVVLKLVLLAWPVGMTTF